MWLFNSVCSKLVLQSLRRWAVSSSSEYQWTDLVSADALNAVSGLKSTLGENTQMHVIRHNKSVTHRSALYFLWNPLRQKSGPVCLTYPVEQLSSGAILQEEVDGRSLFPMAKKTHNVGVVEHLFTVTQHKQSDSVKHKPRVVNFTVLNQINLTILFEKKNLSKNKYGMFWKAFYFMYACAGGPSG